MKNTAQNIDRELNNQRMSVRHSRVSHAQSSLADTVENPNMEVLDIGQQALRACRLIVLAKTAHERIDAMQMAADVTRTHVALLAEVTR